MKGSKITTNNNVKAFFSGEVLATPIKFNPTAADIKRIKGLNKDISEPEYKKTIGDKQYTLISLLLEFNPNKLLNSKDYSNKNFVNYEFAISKDYAYGKNSGKYQIIDDHNQVAWVKVEDLNDVKSAVLKAKASGEYKEKDRIHDIDENTARIAKVGEVALYDLLFNMSNFAPYRKGKEDSLSHFYLGENPHETFDLLVDGVFDILDCVLVNGQFHEFYTDKNDNQLPLGILLGVSHNRNGGLRQEVYTPNTHINISTSALFKYSAKEREITVNDKVYKTKLSKETIKTINDQNYPWDAFIKKTTGKEVKDEFTTVEFVKYSFTEVKDEDLPSSDTSIVDPIQNTSSMFDNNVDDFPF
jgi:hypothetical protein